MTPSISWVDPKRWNELLTKAGLQPVEGWNGEAPEPAPRSKPTVWIERLLERAAGLEGTETAFVVDARGVLLARLATGDAPADGTVEELAGSAADLLEVLEARRRRGDAPLQGMAIVSLGGARRLHVVEAYNAHQRFALGVVAERTLTDRELVDLQLRLGQALG